MLEGFDFENPLVNRSLTGKLKTLKHFNGLRLYSEYFFEGMDRLRNRYLNVSLDEVPLYPVSDLTKEITESLKDFANKAKPVEKNQLFNQEIKEINFAHEKLRVPILGRITTDEPAPVPSSDFNYYDAGTSIEIATSLLPVPEKNEQLFALEVMGDSMSDAMVNDGDFVIMKPVASNEKVRNGEMVAIWLPTRDETTLKYFYRENEGFRLQPANPTLPPILIDKKEPLEIKGKVVMVIRKVDTIQF